ncbi:transcriptional regulator [Staphylococcus gallinarum]|uniref:Transcriptional regulator n=1 Tax=Staphylococcus gallinarum TaxID=1293 RepID=A0A380FL66_STAGA|nr:transcriptional regulator [Staphylococcus gallinarum]
MDIKQMKYFVEVVNQDGMTNASKSLYIAQPTISKAIKDLEKELNMPLFDRSKRQLVLTDAGKIFFQKCKEILTLYNDLPKEINSLLGLETGHISIGLSAVMNMNQFIHILGQFHQQYPNVTYNLVENGGKMIETQLINDEIDIGITTLPVDKTIFHSIPLYQEDLRLVLNKEHELARYDEIEMHMLKDEDFILFNEDFYLNDKIIEAAKNAGFIPNTISKISQWNFIENLLSAHLGVSILPEKYCEYA